MFNIFKRLTPQPKPDYDHNISLEEKLQWLIFELKPDQHWVEPQTGVYVQSVFHEKLINGILFSYVNNHQHGVGVDAIKVTYIMLIDESYKIGTSHMESSKCYPIVYSYYQGITEGPWWNTINELMIEYDIKNKIITHRQLEAKAKREKAAKEYQCKMKCEMKRESIINRWNKQ